MFMAKLENLFFVVAEKFGFNYCVNCGRFRHMSRMSSFCSGVCYEAYDVKVQRHFLQNTLDFHPRARKLMTKRKNFLVVAEDEPYFMKVYLLIRANETEKGTWTTEDEINFIRYLP